MVAIYSILFDEVYYANEMEDALNFINDKSRSSKDFILKAIDRSSVIQKLKDDIELKSIQYISEVDRWLTYDELNEYETADIEQYNFYKNAHLIFNDVTGLVFLNKKEEETCFYGIKVYAEYINKITNPTTSLDESEGMYDWIGELFNLNAFCDKVIGNWTHKMDKEYREKIITERVKKSGRR